MVSALFASSSAFCLSQRSEYVLSATPLVLNSVDKKHYAGFTKYLRNIAGFAITMNWKWCFPLPLTKWCKKKNEKKNDVSQSTENLVPNTLTVPSQFQCLCRAACTFYNSLTIMCAAGTTFFFFQSVSPLESGGYTVSSKNPPAKKDIPCSRAEIKPKNALKLMIDPWHLLLLYSGILSAPALLDQTTVKS